MVLDRAINTPSDGPWSHKKSSALYLVQSKVVHFGKVHGNDKKKK